MCKGPAEDNCVVNDKQPDSDDEEVWLLSPARLAWLAGLSPVLSVAVPDMPRHHKE
jgi:hypothetical protein